MKPKRIFVSAATGAMGQYLIPILLERGFKVDAMALNKFPMEHPNLNSFVGDGYDFSFMSKFLREQKYDAHVDFMTYKSLHMSNYPLLLCRYTGHYIFLSSYRVYDNKEIPIKETSPRLLDSSENLILRNSDDYSVYKARGENTFHALPDKNWTIVRPAITYSYMRYQLLNMEAPMTVGRAFAGKAVALPEQAKNVPATMSWAKDVAEMISRLLFNEQAMRETYTVSTAEHRTWGEIADYYRDICGLKTVWVEKNDFYRSMIMGLKSNASRIFDFDKPVNCPETWQLEYDRLFTRIVDNSKILNATGMKQSDLMPLYDGLKHEIDRCPKDYDFISMPGVAERWQCMDELVEKA